jgi:hypothetical protein
MENTLPIIPTPNNGYYSRCLHPLWESTVISKIKEAASVTLPLDQSKAAKLMLTIYEQTQVFSMPSWPPPWPVGLRTLEEINDFITHRPEIIPWIQQVHERDAFVWLCENGTSK